jgi:hypothetical protein
MCRAEAHRHHAEPASANKTFTKSFVDVDFPGSRATRPPISIDGQALVLTRAQSSSRNRLPDHCHLRIEEQSVNEPEERLPSSPTAGGYSRPREAKMPRPTRRRQRWRGVGVEPPHVWTVVVAEDPDAPGSAQTGKRTSSIPRPIEAPRGNFISIS